jgi:hypothetical protein
MRCPVCRDEFEPDVDRCAECDVDLVAADVPLPPRVDALLGTFHPAVAERILELVSHRRIAADAVPAGDRVEIIVDRDWRDDLRAEFVLRWSELIGRLPEEERLEVGALGGSHPGWFDPPQGAWIDRQGRLQVDPTEDEVAEDEARRVVGPALISIGVVLLLYGWYDGGSSQAMAMVLGLGSIGVGLFVPR